MRLPPPPPKPKISLRVNLDIEHPERSIVVIEGTFNAQALRMLAKRMPALIAMVQEVDSASPKP